MKEVIRYKCEFCKKLFATKKGCEQHEKKCLHNPNAKHCFKCKLSYYGEFYSSEGYPTREYGCCCYYNEDSCIANFTEECSEYIKAEEMYEKRTYDQAEEEYKNVVGGKE